MKFLIQFMRITCIGLLGAIVIAVTALFFASGDVARPAGKKLSDFAISNVNVIDTERGILLRDQTVIISEGRFIDIQPNDSAAALASHLPVIDGAGRYMSPGFWDIHVHLSPRGSAYATTSAMVANGVLYAREMSGDCIGVDECAFYRSLAESRRFQAQIDGEKILSPQLVGIASFIVDGPRKELREPAFFSPATAAQGRALADYLSREGVDFIKPYKTLPRDAYFAMVERANDLALEVGGHVPFSISLREAIEAGQRSIEHARILPLDCSNAADKFHAGYAYWAQLSVEGAREFKNQSFDLYRLTDPGENYGAILAGFNAHQCNTLLAQWAAADSYYVPTHVTRQAEAIVHSRPYLDDPRAAYVSRRALRADWEQEALYYEQRFAENPEQEKEHMDFFLWGMELTGYAYRAGVKIMVGTDAGDMLIYPGFSYHDEMQNLVAAGMPPAAVMRAATMTAAEFEGMDGAHGSVSVGKVANFILLRDNPLEDIANTGSIDAVYYQSRFYERSALDRVLADAASKASGPRYMAIECWLMLSRLFRSVFHIG